MKIDNILKKMKNFIYCSSFSYKPILFIKNLMKKNKIYFISLYRGKTEDYKYIKPEIIEQSYYSKKFNLF